MRLFHLASVFTVLSIPLLVSALPTNTTALDVTLAPESTALDLDLEKRTGYSKGTWQNTKGQWGSWGETSENKHCTSNAKQTCYNKGKSCSSKCVCEPVKPPAATKKKTKRDSTYRQNFCPSGQSACRVDDGGLTGLEGRFECLDLKTDIECVF
jgi:hypothetical protein